MSPGDIVITADDRLGSFAGRRPRAPEAPQPAPAPRAKPKRRAPIRLHLDLSPVQKWAAIGVVVAAIGMSGWVVWRSGVVSRTARHAGEQVMAATAEAGMRISEITVVGRKRTPVDQLVTALAARYGEPILGLDIQAAKERLEALPSVRAAAIERRLPGALHLSIVERQPMALWQTEGRFVLVDRDGRSIPGAIEGFEDLPLVVGEGAPQRAYELFAMLNSEPNLAARVKAATRVGNRRWTVKLDDVEKGLEARLPETDAEGAWHRLAELEKDKSLSAKQITLIDLRVPERLILRSDPQQSAGARPELPAKARED
jgi:cell division protein FtsQ